MALNHGNLGEQNFTRFGRDLSLGTPMNIKHNIMSLCSGANLKICKNRPILKDKAVNSIETLLVKYNSD